MTNRQLEHRARRLTTPDRGWTAIGAIACLYLLCLLALPDRPVFWSPDEGGKYLTLQRIARTGEWSDPLPYPAAPIDPLLQHVPLLYWLRVDNAIYSWWPGWFPALSGLPYRLLGVRGLYLIPIASALLIGLGVYAAVRSLSKRAAWGALLAITLASSVWFYGLTYWEHTLHSLLILSGFAAAIRGVTTNRARWFSLCGLLLGLAFYLRLETMIFIGAIGLLIAGRLIVRLRRRVAARSILVSLLVFGASVIIAVTPFLARNQLIEGHPLGRRNAADVARTADRVLSYGRESALEIAPNVLIGSVGHQGVDLSPSLRWLFVVAAIGCFASGWLLRRGWDVPVYVSALALLALSGFVLLSPEDYSSIHGLVLSAPYLAFAGWGLHPTADRVTRLWGTLAVLGIGLYVFATAIGGWSAQGGLQWGPRYALPLIAVLAIAAARGAHALWNDAAVPIDAQRAAMGCLIALVLIGFGFQLRGLRAMAIDRQTYVTWEAQLTALPDDALIATEYPWLALTLPGVYESRLMLKAQSGALPAGVLERSTQAGYKQVCQPQIMADTLQLRCAPINDP
ncbi:MAG: hypothetical protein HY870_06515 [Chloroflexi bacterium]|nr:hypothetical protein [Chloroflexota bacterium]